jgi:hypothetical protein
LGNQHRFRRWIGGIAGWITLKFRKNILKNARNLDSIRKESAIGGKSWMKGKP